MGRAVPRSSTEQAWVPAVGRGFAMGQGDTRLTKGYHAQGHLFGKFKDVLWSLKQLLLCLR